MTGLTPAQFGELVQISPKTIVAMCAARRIPGAAKVGRQWRIPSNAADSIFGPAPTRHRDGSERAQQTCEGRSSDKGLGFVYFVQAERTGLIKIGYTGALEKRLDSLRGGSAERLELLGHLRATRSLEYQLHSRFAAARLHGEWFRPVDDLLDFVRENAGAP